MSTMSFLTLQNEIAAQTRLDNTESAKNTLIKRWINQAQQEIWSKYDWPWSLEREIVQTVVDKTAGTVSVTAGATTATGASTAFASADVGKYIQFSGSNDWYRITAVASSTSLTIESAYNATSDLSAGTYTIRQFFYSVSSSVEKILSMRQMQTPAKLELMSFRDFDEKKPNVDNTGKSLRYVLYGYDSSDNWRFSLYPSPDAAFNLEVRYKKKSTDLSADADVSEIPEKWHSTVLLDGSLYRGFAYVDGVQMGRHNTAYTRFKEGIREMISDADPESDYHPVMQNRERRSGVSEIVRFPDDYGS